MKYIKRILFYIDSINEWAGKLIAWVVIPNFLALVYEVIARYIFHAPTIWSYEVTYWLYAAHFLIGAGYTLKYDRHIRIDYFYSKMSERTQLIIETIAYLVLFFPVMIVLVKAGIDYALYSLIMKEKSSATALQPLLWPFKAFLPLGFLLLFLQGIAEFIRNVKIIIRGGK